MWGKQTKKHNDCSRVVKIYPQVQMYYIYNIYIYIYIYIYICCIAHSYRCHFFSSQMYDSQVIYLGSDVDLVPEANDLVRHLFYLFLFKLGQLFFFISLRTTTILPRVYVPIPISIL